jgi:hypothetical protein
MGVVKSALVNRIEENSRIGNEILDAVLKGFVGDMRRGVD